MRRWLFSILALVAIVASACGGTDSVEAAVEPVTQEIQLVEADEQHDAGDNESEADLVEEPTEVVEESVEPAPLRTGREAILANHTEGKPYVLWYWGAH